MNSAARTSRLARLSRTCNHASELILLPFTLAFVAIVFFAVLTRFVFQYPIIESVELARLAFVWTILLACAIGVYRQAHVAIFNFRDCLPRAWRLRVYRAVYLLCAGFGGLMLWYGVELAVRVWGSTFPTLGWSQSWLYIPLAISGALILLHGVSHALAPEEFFQP